MNIPAFNPNDPGAADSNIFGLPYTTAQADLVILPVPWEATVSYGSGTMHGPEVILEASRQIDLFHPRISKVWTKKMAMAEADKGLAKLNKTTRKQAEHLIQQLMEGKKISNKKADKVNRACQEMVSRVKELSLEYLKRGKAVATLGGDHSTPLGLMQALAEKNSFGILQIDAHADLRRAYEGFRYSHASIMYNALEEKNISSLTQVGIRDYCEEEVNYIKTSKGRVKVFYDRDLQTAKMEGQSWARLCDKIIATLPEKVFISFDIDGLSPDHCPHTGTPVPGGLSFAEVTYLLEKLANSKKKIIGFDLNEVAPGAEGDWDANVGARVLFLLCCCYFLNKQK